VAARFGRRRSHGIRSNFLYGPAARRARSAVPFRSSSHTRKRYSINRSAQSNSLSSGRRDETAETEVQQRGQPLLRVGSDGGTKDDYPAL
jgi:hypothetical protein